MSLNYDKLGVDCNDMASLIDQSKLIVYLGVEINKGSFDQIISLGLKGYFDTCGFCQGVVNFLLLSLFYTTLHFSV